jgi:hypothetical protein
LQNYVYNYANSATKDGVNALVKEKQSAFYLSPSLAMFLPTSLGAKLKCSALYVVFLVALVVAILYTCNRFLNQLNTSLLFLNSNPNDAYLSGLEGALLVLLWLVAITAYSTDVAARDTTIFCLVGLFQGITILFASIFAALAFGPAIFTWLSTPVGGYTIGSLLLAGLIVAIVLGAAYYDFFRRKRSPGQC